MNNKKISKVLQSIAGLGATKRALLALSVCALLAVVITYVLYSYTQNLLKERLQEKMVAIVATAAEQIPFNDVEAVQSIEDLHTDSMRSLVSQLKKVRDANNEVQYAYIMRRTEDPNAFEFVADAASLTVDPDDDDPPLPGDLFDITEYPVLRDEAFFHPAVDRDLEEDEWSVHLSAYAPILDESGNSIAILGIDVTVDDFRQKTKETLLPFLLFILFLVFLLSLLASLLIRFYGERVIALQEVDRQKDELLSIVSHQLATPVSSVKWYLEMLLDGDVGSLSNDQQEYLKTMQSVTQNLADLVSMILDVSRIQLGKMKVDRTLISLADLTTEIFSVIEPKAKEKSISLLKDLPKHLPKALLDKRLTRMTIENVLSNAVKYTPEGGKVHFSLIIKGENLIISVKDSGRGIPNSEKEKIFSKQFRASNTGNIEGNGFGLYVAKGAVESQGGSISFTSEEGRGTSFIIQLPFKSKQ